MAKAQLKWTDVDSSNVQSVAYAEDLKTLCVRFHNGGLYTYETVDMGVYVDLVHASSVGKYLNQVVKGSFPYTKWHDEQELQAALAAKRKK